MPNEPRRPAGQRPARKIAGRNRPSRIVPDADIHRRPAGAAPACTATGQKVHSLRAGAQFLPPPKVSMGAHKHKRD